jgi:putative hydrolase of the HAD superfamily
VREAVLLDLYGTLVEADWPQLLKGRAALAERVGLSAAAAHGAWDATHVARMKGTYGTLADDLGAVVREASNGSGSPPPISSTMSAQLASEERDNWCRGVSCYPDAIPALRRLRSAGLRLAIVTNASAEAAGVIDDLGLRTLVDEAFASCAAGVLKPELLELALRELGLDASDATLIDDEPSQLDRAEELGLGTILIRRSGADAPPASPESHHVALSDLGQVADLLLADGEPGPPP